MKNKKPGLLLIIVLALWTAVLFLDPAAFERAREILFSFLKEMIQILPFVLVLSALVSEWIPSETVKRHLGEESRWRGALFAYLLGSLSAGPIYAAFPMALALKKKGASVRNLTILISSWAVIKIPMLFMELKSLGLRFTLIRYCLTLPTILALGILMDKFVQKEQMNEELSLNETLVLPGKNCGSCGYSSCDDLREALKADRKAIVARCVFIR